MISLLMVSAITYAGGYRVSTQGQRALAMGHAGVAVVNSAELAFFNPAGLIHLENKINVSVGATAVMANAKWQNTSTGQFAETDGILKTPFYIGFSYKLNEKLALGLSVTTPYGSTVKWPTDWAGSHLVNEIELTAVFIQPLVSYKINDLISLGAGPIYATGSVTFNRNLNRTLTDEEGNRSNVDLEAKGANGFGWSASAMITPMDKLKIGVNYRSEITMKAEDGDATFRNVPNSPLAPVENGTVGFNAELPMPAELSIGFSYEFMDKWLVAIDYNRNFWSAYESLDIDFAPEEYPDSSNPRNYEDSSIYRLGLQYQAMDKLFLRAGYYFDQSPVQSGYYAPETPRNDSQGYTGGFTYQINQKFAVDAAFTYLHFKEINESYDYYQENGQNVPFEGTYKSNAVLVGLGVTYKL